MEENRHRDSYRGDEVTNQSHEQDAHWINRVLQGDRNAYAHIVESYTPTFYSLLKRMKGTSSPENIEDDLQEIFLRIYRALPTFKEGNAFFPWAYTIAINWIRSQRRKSRFSLFTAHVVYDENIAFLQGSRGTDAPEEQLLAAEAENIINEGLQRLKAEYRDVFILRMMQGLSVSETAKILSIPEGTVKTYLHRGRQQLQRWLKKHNWGPQHG